MTRSQRIMMKLPGLAIMDLHIPNSRVYEARMKRAATIINALFCGKNNGRVAIERIEIPLKQSFVYLLHQVFAWQTQDHDTVFCMLF